MSNIIALITDFGPGSHYVGQMKGKILGIHPGATIVDLTHSIAPQDLCQASFVLADCIAAFPPQTTFVAVVDPGVGTDRDIVIAELDGKRLVLPDNGLIQECRHRFSIQRAIRLQPLSMENVSATFHGRDIMAPVAAQLSSGKSLVEFGKPVATEDLVSLDLPCPAIRGNSVTGEILFVDQFGNLISNIDESLLPQDPAGCKVRIGEREIQGICHTYSDLPPGNPVCLVGSNRRLEIAINRENAANTLNLCPGSELVVSWK